MAADRPLASEAQLRFLDGLTHPDALAHMTSSDARWLIGWLKGPPRNMTRPQQTYIYGMLDQLTREQVREVVELLKAMTAPKEGAG